MTRQFRAIDKVRATALTSWRAPTTGLGRVANLEPGEVILIDQDSIDRDTHSVAAEPKDAGKLEDRFVSKDDRENEMYAGYYLLINRKDLNKFEMIDLVS